MTEIRRTLGRDCVLPVVVHWAAGRDLVPENPGRNAWVQACWGNSLCGRGCRLRFGCPSQSLKTGGCYAAGADGRRALRRALRSRFVSSGLKPWLRLLV